MSDEKAFLSRWSRLKRRSQDIATPEAPPVQAARAEQPEAVEDATGPTKERDLDAAESAPLLGEDLPDLPPIETLTNASDFRPFMRPGVADTLRLAALRRLWALDPAIRDFVGPARDYAWDWNVPGDVPGSGPLLDSDDVQRLVARIFGDDTAEAAGPVSNVSETSPTAAAIATDSGSSPAAAVEDRPTVQLATQNAVPEVNPAATAPVRTRRHGGAMPE